LARVILAPQHSVTPEQRERAARNLLIDAAAATAIGALNSGVVLLALALHIGAGNVQIGLLAAIPLLTQILQAPTVTLVERVRRRRLISVASVFTARLALPTYAIVPFIPDRDLAVAVLLAAALLHYGLNAVGACSWNSWMRDLLPPERLGQFFSRRGLYGTTVSTAATIAAAVALDAADGSRAIGNWIFCGLYLTGFAFGLVSTAFLAMVPEPQMPPPGPTARLSKLLMQPLKDRTFRNILRYLASWQFAVNLATPFFTVYFVRELGFSMSFVLILSVVSSLANIAVVRGWGALSDRFTNKSVLSVATPLFLLCIAGMAFASEFDSIAGRAAYLVVLHVAMGAAGAGVGIASGNIVLKLSPRGTATSYMAANALIGAVAAGAAPIVGGWAADFFARRELKLSLEWTSPSGTDELFGFAFTHWEFFFLLSALLGLYTLHRLTTIDEPGSVEGREVVGHVWTSARRTLRNASSVAGLRMGVAFPGADLIRARQGKRVSIVALLESTRRRLGFGATAVATSLTASYPEPQADAQFDDLLRQLDAKG
jgi:MFS family permease